MKSLTILIVFLMATCGGSDSSTADYEAAPMLEEMDVAESSIRKVSAPLAQQPNQDYQKKVIKTGGLSYSVANTKEEYNRISTMLDKYDAYISSENESKGYDRINYNISIKVPPQNFDPLIGDLTSDKKLDNRWVNTDDVTERYYDLQSRIANKKKLEERYQEILKKADNVRDILEVERNLNQVRTEIESLQGQFKLLGHKISYSTLDVAFYELIPYELDQEPRPGFGTRMLNSISAGWQGFLTFMVYLLALWPFGLLAVGIVWVVKKVRAKRKADSKQ
ncbi:DUF4349 domain-containing protein [Ekhidna sp.]|uniref:DUF4349 domain-containing protein n=1 Tax=Ekhidna sp. TaxID=2608089 RepID=UPI003298DC3B